MKTTYLHHLVVGGYYRNKLDDRIAYITGAGPSGVIGREEGGPDKSLGDSKAFHQGWALTELRDFPNAKDPRLPYVFDLFWDLKYTSDLQRELKKPDCDQEIRDKAREHNFLNSENQLRVPA